MKEKKTIRGICRICKTDKELSFEHIPPKSAYNSNNRFYKVDIQDYYENYEDYTKKGLKPKSKINQGGLGEYCLCKECNGFLGSKYVREYKKFADIAMGIIYHSDVNIKCFQFDVSDVNLFVFLKQIIAIFVCSNPSEFTDSYPELLEFIKFPELEVLPEKYRVYMYLNNEGQVKSGKFHFTNTHGVICDFTYPPFGFVLSIGRKERIMEVSEITGFKFYNKLKRNVKVPITLNKYPTYSPRPLDFRPLS